MTAGVHVEVVDDLGRTTALVPEWEALADRCATGFAARASYALSWFTCAGRGELAVVVARRDGRLVALAPLHRRRLLGQPVLRWLGHGLGTVGELLAEDADAATAVWSSLAADGVPLQLSHVRADDPGSLALRRDSAWSVRLRLDDRCPVLRPADAAPRSKRSLKRLGQYRRGLERDVGPFALEVVTDAAGLDRRWPDVVRVAAAADRGRDRLDLCAPPFDGFTRRFLSAEADAGRLLLVGATVAGRWVAHEVGLRTGGTMSMWLSRFDPELAAWAPGHLVMRELLDRAEELGIDRFDFGPGENAYKLAWAQDGYDIATVTAASRTPALARGRLAAAGGLGDAARRLRR